MVLLCFLFVMVKHRADDDCCTCVTYVMTNAYINPPIGNRTVPVNTLLWLANDIDRARKWYGRNSTRLG
jgi:hypothetical protein